MKRLIIFLLLIPAGGYHATAQQILDSLIGRWEVKEVYKNKKSVQPAGIIIFGHDGIFKSVSTYLGTATGFYRTDETRSALYIEIDEETTEWSATIKNNVLRLQSARKKRKEPKILMVLTEEAPRRISGNP